MSFPAYLSQNKDQIFSLLVEHIQLTAIAVVLSICIGVPLGILICYIKPLYKPILGIANIVQAIPSMALLGFAIPFLGIGTLPAVTVVIIYSLLPIIKNTCTGIENINPQTLEAAKGIGLTRFQILSKIQIPLALPVIMAGVRISAVTAVGLMTLAAFIGAGGLGYLVYSGIRTVNNNQILAGAIPACILALIVDALISQIEGFVTPISLQKNSGSMKDKKKMRQTQKITLIATSLVVIFAFIFTSISHYIDNDKIIKVGTKDFTEQMILGHLVSDVIEGNTDISVDRKVGLGGTQVIFSSLISGDIDMYVEYSGTAYGDTLNYPPISDTNEVFETVKKDFKEMYDIDTLTQSTFNNTYALAVTKETASKYNLRTVSDLAKVSGDLKFGTTLEFANRNDGLLGLKKVYNFTTGSEVGLDGAQRYVALVNDEIDVTDAFSTDGLLQKYDLVILEDDKEFFPPYHAMPLIRHETLEKYPEIEPYLNELSLMLTEDVMVELNYKVDELQMDPAVVAHDYLIETGMISK